MIQPVDVTMLGGKKFIKWVKATFFKGRIDRDIPQTRIMAPEKHVIIDAVCKYYSVTQKQLVAVRRGVV